MPGIFIRMQSQKTALWPKNKTSPAFLIKITLLIITATIINIRLKIENRFNAKSVFQEKIKAADVSGNAKISMCPHVHVKSRKAHKDRIILFTAK